MRLLILNWKDTRHPRAGGAEIVTQRFAQELVRRGHHVTLFVVHYHGLKKTEVINGVTVIRQGNFLTMYGAAFFYYWNKRQQIDLVIDQFHFIPFYTPLYVRKPTLAFIHEIAGDIWSKYYPAPFDYIGKGVEKIALRLYHQVPFLTDSHSTKDELIALSIPPKQIAIIPLTIDPPKIGTHKKSLRPQLVYIGRLTPIKQIELLIKANALIVSKSPQLRCLIVGSGNSNYEAQLKMLITRLHLEKNVVLLGQISQFKKYQLLAASWLHIQPSFKEGFGLTVLEAAAVGTPTICFNVPGLRDVVTDGVNGRVVKNMTPEALGETLQVLLSQPRKIKQLSKSSYRWAKSLPSWKRQTDLLENLLSHILTDYQQTTA